MPAGMETSVVCGAAGDDAAAAVAAAAAAASEPAAFTAQIWDPPAAACRECVCFNEGAHLLPSYHGGSLAFTGANTVRSNSSDV